MNRNVTMRFQSSPEFFSRVPNLALCQFYSPERKKKGCVIFHPMFRRPPSYLKYLVLLKCRPFLFNQSKIGNLWFQRLNQKWLSAKKSVKLNLILAGAVFCQIFATNQFLTDTRSRLSLEIVKMFLFLSNNERVIVTLGRGGGLVVTVLAFLSDNPNFESFWLLNFSYKKTKISEKEAGVGSS